MSIILDEFKIKKTSRESYRRQKALSISLHKSGLSEMERRLNLVSKCMKQTGTILSDQTSKTSWFIKPQY